jgi:hypothetical protein
MARPETLIPGNCYFSVGYYDKDLLLPMVDTLVFVGQETGQEEGRLWLFKEPESPPNPDEQDEAPELPPLIAFSDRQLHEVVDFNGLMQRFREIASDHPLKPLPQTAAEPTTDEDFQSVSGEVARFLNDLESVSLTMTIRFTDDGLSLSRREEGYGMNFFPHPRRDPNKDSRLISFFENDGIHPVVDYSVIGAARACSSFLFQTRSTRLSACVGVCSPKYTQCVEAMVSTMTS